MATVTRSKKSVDMPKVSVVLREMPEIPAPTHVAPEPQASSEPQVQPIDWFTLWFCLGGIRVMAGHMLFQTFGLPGWWTIIP